MDETICGSIRFIVFLFKFGLGKQHLTEMDQLRVRTKIT